MWIIDCEFCCEETWSNVGRWTVDIQDTRAPEYKYPTAINDYYDAFKWVSSRLNGILYRRGD